MKSMLLSRGSGGMPPQQTENCLFKLGSICKKIGQQKCADGYHINVIITNFYSMNRKKIQIKYLQVRSSFFWIGNLKRNNNNVITATYIHTHDNIGRQAGKKDVQIFPPLMYPLKGLMD